jgi:hypothetical protein
MVQTVCMFKRVAETIAVRNSSLAVMAAITEGKLEFNVMISL